MKTRVSVLVILLLLAVEGLSAAEQLVPLRNRNQRNDVLGFRWDLQLDGQISDGSNDCFDGAMGLWIDAGSQGQRQFQQDRQPMATADGAEWVLTNSFNDLVVTRRVRLDSRQGIMRYVEVVTNRGDASLPVELQINIDLGHSVRQAQTSAGRACNGEMSLNPEERGFQLVQQGGRPSLAFYMGRLGDDIGGSLMADQGMGDIWYRFRFEVPARSTVSVVHGVAQRLAGRLPGGDALAVCDGPGYLDDLPEEIRSTIINTAKAGSAFACLSVDDLGLEAGASDLVAMGDDSLLRGRFDWQQAVLESAHGDLQLDPEEVLGLTGPGWSQERDLVFLRDGQVLSGRLRIEQPVVHLDAGFSVPLAERPLDRVRMRSRADRSEGPQRGWFVAAQGGDVYRVRAPVGVLLRLATPWGGLELAMDEVRSLAPLVEDPIGAMELTTERGLRVPVLLSGEPLVLQHERFGSLAFEPAMFAGLRGPTSFQEQGEPASAVCRLSLDGFDLVGEVRDETLTLTVAGRPLSLPWRQVASLERSEHGHIVSLWNGSRLVGPLVGAFLTVRVGAGDLRLPLADIEGLQMPEPGLSPAQRARILDLVERLGDPTWGAREAATRELTALGPPAHAMLEELREDQQDEEIRHRLDLILEGGNDEGLP